MLIEHTIRRNRQGQVGTVITMPPTKANPNGARYHFRPTGTDPRHMAEVKDAAHIKRFLGIETFVIAEDEAENDGVTDDQPSETPSANGQDGASGQQGAGETAPASDPAEGDTAGSIPIDQMTDEQLAEKHEALFGKPPRSNASRATIVSKLKAALAQG